MRTLLTVLALSTIGLGSAVAQITTTGVEAAPGYDTFMPPPRGGTYVDPVFGTSIKRVSDAKATANADQGGYLTWIENEYATMTPFNSDNSKFILVHQSYFGLYDGDGTFLHSLPLAINSSSEPRWSRKDNATLYYHAGNQLKSYNISTGATNLVHTFTQYSSISGNGEMDISLDGDHFVFAGNNRYVFVYQISTDKVFTALDTSGYAFDSMYITPNNNVIVSWLTSGTTRHTGQELFDIQMNFLRQVSHADGHKHVTRDTNGDEVLVWTNSNDPQPLANCQNGIVKIRLSDSTQTCLLQLAWTLAVHISASDGNGTVMVDTEAPANPEPGTSAWVPYTNELLQVKLDGTGTTRLAHHRSRPVNSYNWQPKLSVSRDGTHLLFAGNYDLSNIMGNPVEYSDTYMIVLAATAAAPPTPPPSGTASVVRDEQTNPAVAYSGTWYPNYGTFNSGSSATMAMDAGSQAKITFTGTGVKWIGFSDPWSGIAKVYVDGILTATIDTYASVQKAQAIQYSVANLSNATHTLAIVATGTHSPQSGGSWVWVDAFDVTIVTVSRATTLISQPAVNAPRM
jgi:hypothetical protein